MLCTLDVSESGAEYASEATEYFDSNISNDTVNGKYNGVFIFIFIFLPYYMCLYLFILESNMNDLKLLRDFGNWKPSSKIPQICLPSMSEDRFVLLCKTMYDLIGNSPIKQEIHNNISRMSNLHSYLL